MQVHTVKNVWLYEYFIFILWKIRKLGNVLQKAYESRNNLFISSWWSDRRTPTGTASGRGTFTFYRDLSSFRTFLRFSKTPSTFSNFSLQYAFSSFSITSSPTTFLVIGTCAHCVINYKSNIGVINSDTVCCCCYKHLDRTFQPIHVNKRASLSSKICMIWLDLDICN